MTQFAPILPQKGEMMEPGQDRENLLRLRDETLRALVALAKDRDRAEGLMSTILSLERAMSVMEPMTLKFGRHKRAKEAIEHFLRDENRAATDEEIVEQVTAGGFRYGKANVKTVLRKALKYYLTHPEGIKQNSLRRKNQLIGLYQWPDERFEADAKRPQA